MLVGRGITFSQEYYALNLAGIVVGLGGLSGDQAAVYQIHMC